MSAFYILWNNKLIKQTSNRRKYCSSCWKKQERKLWRENKRKHRNVQVQKILQTQMKYSRINNFRDFSNFYLSDWKKGRSLENPANLHKTH